MRLICDLIVILCGNLMVILCGMTQFRKYNSNQEFIASSSDMLDEVNEEVIQSQPEEQESISLEENP
jgi:hypothetical protein